MPFFRGYHPSELDEHGEPLPAPVLGPLVIVMLIVGLTLLVKVLVS